MQGNVLRKSAGEDRGVVPHIRNKKKTKGKNIYIYYNLCIGRLEREREILCLADLRNGSEGAF
jgi:hypothetical protein